MTKRPEWAHAILDFLGDDIFDQRWYPEDGSADEIAGEIAAQANVILCREYGHEIADDMCRKPEHRYCLYCGRLESDLLAND